MTRTFEQIDAEIATWSDELCREDKAQSYREHCVKMLALNVAERTRLLAETEEPGEDAKLPCDVLLPPATRIKKGVNVTTLLTALGQRQGIDTDFGDIFKAVEQLANLQAQNAKLGEALEPFAKRAEHVHPETADDVAHWHPSVGSVVTVGDLRRARAARAATQDGTEGGE